MSVAVFAGGCFWCTEAVFTSLKGVISVVSGYTGGTIDNPTYDEVSQGTTGHAEAIKIEYDPSVITYKDLLTVFFASHDPRTLNQQGNDIGTQYRSAIFFADEEQQQEAEQYIEKVISSGVTPVTTTLEPLGIFYPAENYHQDYYKNNPENRYCQIIIDPKIEKLQKKFSNLLKDAASKD